MPTRKSQSVVSFKTAFDAESPLIDAYYRNNINVIAELLPLLIVPDSLRNEARGDAAEAAKSYNKAMKKPREMIIRGYGILYEGLKPGQHFPESLNLREFGAALLDASAVARLYRPHYDVGVTPLLRHYQAAAAKIDEEIREFSTLARNLGEAAIRGHFARAEPGIGEFQLKEKVREHLPAFLRDECGLDPERLRQIEV